MTIDTAQDGKIDAKTQIQNEKFEGNKNNIKCKQKQWRSVFRDLFLSEAWRRPAINLHL